LYIDHVYGNILSCGVAFIISAIGMGIASALGFRIISNEIIESGNKVANALGIASTITTIITGFTLGIRAYFAFMETIFGKR
jgi:hypothetical protein